MGWVTSIGRRLGLSRSVSSEFSDYPIAEALAVRALREQQTLYSEVAQHVHNQASLDMPGMLLYVISVIAYAYRRSATRSHRSRLERIEATFAKIAIAQFLHAAPLKAGVDRDDLLSRLIGQYLQQAPTRSQNFSKLEAAFMGGKEKALYSFMTIMCVQLCGEKAVDFSNLPPLVQSVGGVYTRALKAWSEDEFEPLAAVEGKTPGVTINLPASWRARRTDPWLYSDMSTPQYNFLLTVLPPLPGAPKSGSPESALTSILAANPLASGAQYASLGKTRAMAQYRTSMPEDGHDKDDYHWWLLEIQSKATRLASFTLSALADKANSQNTAALAESFRERVATAKFS